MKVQNKVQVKNQLGLHTRPATSIVKLLHGCKSDVSFTYKRETVNARSILGILTLAVKSNERLTITVDGADAEETMLKLLTAFENRFEDHNHEICLRQGRDDLDKEKSLPDSEVKNYKGRKTEKR